MPVNKVKCDEIAIVAPTKGFLLNSESEQWDV